MLYAPLSHMLYLTMLSYCAISMFISSFQKLLLSPDVREALLSRGGAKISADVFPGRKHGKFAFV